ncbi:MAG: Ig-like domain-containing protein [Patescibacteria group bacterium]|nr:Ig-like domain-containing protein [Patescibacteria group bacterium]
MKNNLWDKKIPTLLGIFMIAIGITVTSLLVRNGTIFVSKASPTNTPKNIRIANVSEMSFTVSYETDASVLGSISYGESANLGSTELDARDQQSGNVAPYKLHYFTVRGLKPSTKYFFNIVSGQDMFQNNETLFDITTAPNISASPSQQQPIVGKVIMPDGTNPAEAIVYVTIPGAQTTSTLVKQDGSYIIPLNALRNSNLQSFFPISKDTKLQMLIIGPGLGSNITVFANQINSVPTVTLSKNYDFTSGDSPINVSEEESSASANVNFPSFSANEVSNKNAEILVPENDEKFTDQKPLFKGIASPGASIKLIIHSDENIQTQVKVDSKGNWSYRPEKSLSPGQHTVSIIAPDKFGVLKTITQSFTVYAQGSQVTESATPSATPTIRITLSPTPTTILLSPTQTPLPTLTLAPTPTIAQAPVASATPTVTPAKPGNSSAIIVAIAAIATSAIGVLLFLVTRGTISL